MTLERNARAAPRVSVITIFYNAEKHFREAIDSVLAQDFRDFELLLVDDGSTDGGSAMARDYADRDPRVRYLEHPGHANRGMSASRNLGVSHARGEFVAFIDADDRWRGSKLAEQIQMLETMPDVDAVGGSVNYWSSHSGGKDRVVPTAHVQNRAITAPEATLSLYPLGKADAPSMSDLMLRRASILAAGGFEERFTGAYEDQAFLAKFYLESTLYLTTKLWSDYRIHDDSCMARTHREGMYRDTRRSFLEWFQAYVPDSRHAGNAAIAEALERALRDDVAESLAAKVRRRIRAASPAFAVSAVRAARSAVRGLRPRLAPGPAILMYHRIADECFDPWGLAVSAPNFAEQMEWIAANRTVLPLGEFAELHRRRSLPRDAVAITFDDGYACNSKVAAPLLERLGLASTIFLSAEPIEAGREFWWDELARLVLECEGGNLSLNQQQVRLGEKQLGDAFWAPAEPPRTARQRAYRELWSMLYPRSPADLAIGMEQLRSQAQLPDAPRSSHRPLSREEIAALPSQLVEFGSHAITHASLPRLGPEEKAREIDGSIERCAKLTGRQPRSFAYPYGDYDAASRQLVERAGFRCACKADGWFVNRKADTFALPRIFVGNWEASRLARNLGRP